MQALNNMDSVTMSIYKFFFSKSSWKMHMVKKCACIYSINLPVNGILHVPFKVPLVCISSCNCTLSVVTFSWMEGECTLATLELIWTHCVQKNTKKSISGVVRPTLKCLFSGFTTKLQLCCLKNNTL